MRTETRRMHDDDKAFIIVAIGALIAVAIAVSAITTSPGGRSHRLLHSRDASGGSPPSAVEVEYQIDEVLAVRIVAERGAESVDGRGTRTVPSPVGEPDRTTLVEGATTGDRAVRVVVDAPADG